MARLRLRGRRSGAAQGQALVEFALVVLPLLLIIVGVVQFGLLLNTNVTLTNAAREGARAGTIYEYDVALSQPANDAARCAAISAATLNAFGLLKNTAPQFVTGTCAGTGDSWSNGDIQITYVKPGPIGVNSEREGYEVTVTLTYRQDIIVPLIGGLLTRDSNGRFVQQARVTMVVN